MPHLEGWEVLPHPYTQREILVGVVSGDTRPNITNGKEIWTSQVVAVDRVRNVAVTKSGTVYTLGTPRVKNVAEGRAA